MNKEGVGKIIQLIKDGASKFCHDYDKNLNFYFHQETNENNIIIHFIIKYDRELEFLIGFKKLNTSLNEITELNKYTKLDLNSNPYKNLNFSDENTILGNIYDNLKEIAVDEIACYKKLGIIIKNPLDLKGYYLINIKYITD